MVAGGTARTRVRMAPLRDEQAYFLERMRASLAMAVAAAGTAAKLIHYDLAGRYSVAAAHASKGDDGLIDGAAGAAWSRGGMRPASVPGRLLPGPSGAMCPG